MCPASWSAWSAPTAAASPTSSTPCAGCSANRRPSELRGESMQDVIFNGSANRKPARPRLGRAGVRQRATAAPAASGRQYAEIAVKRVLHARRHVELLHQQPAGAPARHPGHVPRHRPRPARLRHHRPGHDLAHHRGEARRAARVPRGGRGRLQVQGAPPRDREPPARHAREPDARRRHPARAQRQPREARGAGRGRDALQRAAGRRQLKQHLLWFLQARARPRPTGARARPRPTRRATISSRAWPTCAASRASWRRSARRTTPPATRSTRRRASSMRPAPKWAGSRPRSASWSKAARGCCRRSRR